jgi:hypothetical protein
MEQDDYEIWLEAELQAQREILLGEDLLYLDSEKLAEEHLKQRRLDEYKDSSERLQHVCVAMGAVMEEITKKLDERSRSAAGSKIGMRPGLLHPPAASGCSGARSSEKLKCLSFYSTQELTGTFPPRTKSMQSLQNLQS